MTIVPFNLKSADLEWIKVADTIIPSKNRVLGWIHAKGELLALDEKLLRSKLRLKFYQRIREISTCGNTNTQALCIKTYNIFSKYILFWKKRTIFSFFDLGQGKEVLQIYPVKLEYDDAVFLFPSQIEKSCLYYVGKLEKFDSVYTPTPKVTLFKKENGDEFTFYCNTLDSHTCLEFISSLNLLIGRDLKKSNIKVWRLNNENQAIMPLNFNGTCYTLQGSTLYLGKKNGKVTSYDFSKNNPKKKKLQFTQNFRNGIQSIYASENNLCIVDGEHLFYIFESDKVPLKQSHCSQLLISNQNRCELHRIDEAVYVFPRDKNGNLLGWQRVATQESKFQPTSFSMFRKS